MTQKQLIAIVARAGYGARGAVYVLLGLVCLASVFSGMGDEGSPKGALSLLTGNPIGILALVVVAVCLLGFVGWRMMQSVLNADDQDNDLKGFVARAACFASGITYLGLAFSAARLALTSASDDGGSGSESLAQRLMEQPFGQYLVGAVGLILIGAGIAQIWRGLAQKYEKWIDSPADQKTLVHFICGFGLSVRGLLFIIAGGFFLYAAITVDPDQAGSTSEALDWLRSLPFGIWLYGGAALGLIAFGAYSVIEAFYRRVGHRG